MQAHANRMDELLQKLVEDTQKFLQEHPNLVFYSAGFYCNTEDNEIILCFNTEEAFQELLNRIQNNTEDSKYHSEKQIEKLRFNMEEWAYRGISVCNFSNEEDLTVYINSKESNTRVIRALITGRTKRENEIIKIYEEVCNRFYQTTSYKSIPKSDKFIYHCVLVQHYPRDR